MTTGLRHYSSPAAFRAADTLAPSDTGNLCASDDLLASIRCMRTTLDIDPSVLAALKQRQQLEHKTLGGLVSELLADALARNKPTVPPPAPWIAKPMRAKVDLDDKDALYTALGEQ